MFGKSLQTVVTAPSLQKGCLLVLSVGLLTACGSASAQSSATHTQRNVRAGERQLVASMDTVILQPGEEQEMHPHVGMAFSYVVDGTISVVLDGRAQIIEQGHYFVEGPGVVHEALGNVSGDKPATIVTTTVVPTGQKG